MAPEQAALCSAPVARLASWQQVPVLAPVLELHLAVAAEVLPLGEW